MCSRRCVLTYAVWLVALLAAGLLAPSAHAQTAPCSSFYAGGLTNPNLPTGISESNTQCAVILQGTLTAVYASAQGSGEVPAGCTVTANLQILSILSGNGPAEPATWGDAVQAAMNYNLGNLNVAGTLSISNCAAPIGLYPGITSAAIVVDRGLLTVYYFPAGSGCVGTCPEWGFTIGWGGTDSSGNFWSDSYDFDTNVATSNGQLSVTPSMVSGTFNNPDPMLIPVSATLCMAPPGATPSCSGSTPTGATPTLTSISSIAPQPNQTITITGSGFGTQTPYNGDSSYLEISDLTGNWTAGYSNNQVTLNVTSWTNSQIVIQGFTGDYGQNNWVLNPGDTVQVSVWNPQSGSGPATQTVTIPASGGSGAIVLTSVSSIAPQPNQTITLTGSGFGTQTPYNGDSSYLEIADLTGNWTAGYINNGSPNQVTLNVTSWTNSQIVIQGFTGDYGQNNWVLNPGDTVQVSVWNPQSGSGPATQTVTIPASGGSGQSGSLVWTLNNAVLQPGFGSPKVTGSFTYNADTATYSAWSLSVSGSSSPFTPETFTPSNSFVAAQTNSYNFWVTDPTTNQTLILAFCGGPTGTSQPLTGSGGTLNLCTVAGGGLDFDSNPPVIDSPFVSGTVSSSGTTPVLTSVSSIAAQPNQTITLTGSGFGSQTAFNGDSSYLEIADLTGNWTAGYINNGSPNQVTLNVTSWTNSQIVIQGFTGDYGQNNWVLNPGDKVQVSVWNPQSGSGPATQTVTIASTSSTAPVVTSVSSAASYAAGVVAPGEIVYIAGSGMGPGQLATLTVNSSGLVSTQLAGTSVQFSGIAAPMVYTSATAVAAIVPYEVSGSTAQVTLTYQGQTSAPFQVSVASSVPGLFTANASGTGQLAALNQDGSVNSVSNPAAPGSIVSLFATGEGQTSPSGQDGKPATPPLPQPLLPVTVKIGGYASTVSYAGGAPGEVAGVMQVNVQIPAGAGGSATPVLLNVGNAQSQTGATIAITGTASTGTPASIRSISGNSQTASVSQAFPAPLVVEVTDASGNPISGASITWAVSQGNATLSNSSTSTNAAGQASTNVTAGSSSGTVVVTAAAGAATAQFNLTVTVVVSTNAMVFGTGQNVSNGTDNSYQIIADTTGEIVAPAPAFVVTNLAGGWATIPGAAWIAPSADQSNATRNPCCANTSDTYQTTFTVSGNPSSVSLNLTVAADDYVDVSLNGNSVFTHPTTAMWGTPVTFSINTGFVSGTNTLDFLVTNAGGPTGLMVAVTSPVSGQTQVTPGQTLTIGGSFNTAASVTTTALFSDNGGYQVSVLPVSVTSAAVSILVPPYLNPQQGTVTSGAVSVSVVQQPASGQGSATAPLSLQVGALPQTGVAPGLITLDVLTQLSQLAGTANQTWSTIAQESGGIVNASQLSLSALQSSLSAAQADVQDLISGTVSQVSLGQIGGQSVYLDLNSLALMDQVFYAYYLGSTSTPAQVNAALRRRTSVRLVSSHPHQDGDDPLTNFHNWLAGEITSTLPQSIASNVSQLRGAASAAIGLAVLVAAPAEAAVASAAVVGGFVWMATTWAAAATTAALEGAGSDILNQQPADVSDFSNTMSIIGNGYFETLTDNLLDVIAEAGEEAGQTAKTIVQTVVNTDEAIDPEDEEGVTDETTTAANESLFNAGSQPFNGTWSGSYNFPSQTCPGETQSGQLIFYITQSSPTSFSGTASLTGLKFFNTSDCSVAGTADSSSGTVSGTVGSDGSLTATASFTLDVSSIPSALDDSETFSLQGTLSDGSMSGPLNGGTFNLSL